MNITQHIRDIYNGLNINSVAVKTTPVDADKIGIWDSVSGLLRSVTGADWKAYFKSYFDTIYSPITPAGSVVKAASYDVSSYVTGTDTIPFDDSIPQISEGTQFASIVYTPKMASSSIYIIVNFQITCSVVGHVIMALFDGSANAIGVRSKIFTSTNGVDHITAVISYSNTSLATKTFSARMGANSAATVGINGATSSTSRLFGGNAKSTMIILEVAN